MAGADTRGARTYRALESAYNTYESVALAELKEIVTDKNRVAPYLEAETQALTVYHGSVAFRMATRAGAGVHGNLKMRHALASPCTVAAKGTTSRPSPSQPT